MSLHPEIKDAIEEIDAALFSGDSFYDDKTFGEFEAMLLRWLRRMKEIQEETA